MLWHRRYAAFRWRGTDVVGYVDNLPETLT
jgi:hypothetical protein